MEGGLAAHNFIRASDKDYVPIFEKFCALSSYDLFQYYNGGEIIYSAEECEMLNEKVEELRED